MVSSPVQNLSYFFKNKPPLVIFLLCLVALAVSTFYYAFEIQNDEPTIDSDKKQDWISMLKHFNKLDSCLKLSAWSDENQQQFDNELTLHTKITFQDVNVLKPYTQIRGALSLQGWNSRSCHDPEKLPKEVEISFDVPSKVIDSNGSYEICTVIRGPAQFLPLLKDSGCEPEVVAQNKNSKVVKGLLSSKSSKTYDPTFCSEGQPVKVGFDLEQPDVRNYLNDDVRTEIYIHLMWCSYFLVFIIFCILLYALLKKSEYWEKKEQSARLL